MNKPRGENGEKSFVSRRLQELRRSRGLSLRAMEKELKSRGLPLDRNILNRIEKGERHVTDIELQGLSRYFEVSYEKLLDEPDKPEC